MNTEQLKSQIIESFCANHRWTLYEPSPIDLVCAIHYAVEECEAAFRSGNFTNDNEPSE